jgi:hypothetical protein
MRIEVETETIQRGSLGLARFFFRNYSQGGGSYEEYFMRPIRRGGFAPRQEAGVDGIRVFNTVPSHRYGRRLWRLMLRGNDDAEKK